MDSRPIGLFDSGLGGLTVLRALLERLPNESYIYLGDTARTPYGSKGVGTVQAYSRQCARFLTNQDVKLLVVACNTASAVALDLLLAECACPVIGTIDPAVEAALRGDAVSKVGVIGTSSTIASGVYQRALERADSALQVFAKACPLFVPLVEEGILTGRVVDQVLDLYLQDLAQHGIERLILGCTHYPVLVPALSDYFDGLVEIVSCADEIARVVERELQSLGAAERSVGAVRYFVTDEVSRFNKLAGLYLKDSNVNALALEELLNP